MGLMSGIKVIDLTWGMAGPVATMLFADNGADVIKVEPPGGDPFRYLKAYHVWNRGKRSVTADLKTPEGKQFVLDLCRDADIVIESFRPGAMDRLGLGFDEMHKKFPRLVYTSISGYGADHPRRNEPGHEGLIDTYLGMHDEQQGTRPGPRYNALPVASYGACFLAGMGALAALRARDITGRGQHVETSMADGLVMLNIMNWYWSEQHCDKGKTTPPAGKLFMRHLMQLGVMGTSDGKFMQVHTGPVGKWQQAIALLGLKDKVPDLPIGQEKALPFPPEEARFLEKAVPEALAQKPREHWLKVFEEADIAALPVDPPGVAFDDPQIVHEKLIITVDDPELGPIKMVGPTMKCPQAPPAVRGPAPTVGQHNAEVRAELAAAKPRAVPPPTGKSLKHPMEGVRILDFGAFFAGPFASKMMSDFGADVIKVEPPAGEAMRNSDGPFRAAQRGKRDIAIDMKSKEGQAIMRDLIAKADIITHNMRPGAAERLGIDYESAKKIKPDVVYLYAPGFGSTGPRVHLQAFAPMVSGMCGVLSQAAGKGNKPCQTVTNEDHINGSLGAVWLLMGLNYKNRTGQGVYMEASLMTSTLFAQGETILKPDGTPVFRFESDSQQYGLGPLERLYPTADGHVCMVAATPREWQALTKVQGLEALATDKRFAERAGRDKDADALAGVLEVWFKGRSTNDAVAALRKTGVPCEVPHASRNVDYFFDEQNVKLGRVVSYEHKKFGKMRDMGHAIRFSETPGHIPGPSPLLGEHTVEILREYGYAEDKIKAFVDQKLVRVA